MEKQKKVETIIGVGYEVEFSAMGDILEKYHPGIKQLFGMEEKDRKNWTVLSGVYYATECRGIDNSDKKSQIELDSWFRRRGGNSKVVTIKTLYVSKYVSNSTKKELPDTIACEMQIANERIYSFLLNRENKSTSLQKKLIHRVSSGHTDEKPQYSQHHLNACYVTVRAYKHISEQTQELTMIDEDGNKQSPYWKIISTVQKTMY